MINRRYSSTSIELAFRSSTVTESRSSPVRPVQLLRGVVVSMISLRFSRHDLIEKFAFTVLLARLE